MTTTSNIHLGIAGWSNATYVVGARRSNAGNAYQCTTAGTSTSPPTGTGTGIANGGISVWKYLSAVDFTTLAAWAASATVLPATLTQPVIALLWNDSTVTAPLGTPIVTLTGHTTSGSNTITITPAPGESFQAVYQAAPTTAYAYNAANGVAFQCPAAGTSAVNYFLINDSNVILDGLQFKDPNSTSGCSIIGGSGSNLTIRHCIIDGFAQTGGAIPIGVSGNGLTITNTLVVGRNTTVGGAMLHTNATGYAIANNTFVHATLVTGQQALGSGTNVATSTMTSTNNIFYNYAIPYSASSGTPWLSSHCAYSAASFSGSNNGSDAGGSIFGITAAATFANFATDMHVKAGASSINAGLTDTTDIPAADDAFGTARPQGTFWDIGAHELLAVSAIVTRDFTVAMMVLQSMPNLPDPFSGDFTSDFGVGPYNEDPSFGIEWKQSYRKDNPAPIEWANSFVSHPISLTGQIPIEIKQSLPGLPNPWSQAFSSAFGVGPFTTDPIFPIEFRSTSPGATRDVGVGIEWRATFQRDIPAAAEFGGGMFRDSATPTDWRVSLAFTAAAPIDAAGTLVLNNSSPAERGGVVLRDAQVPAEWGGGAGFIANASFGIDWLQPVAGVAAVPIVWAQPVIADSSAPIQWTQSLVGSVAAPAEWIQSVLANSGGPVEWQSPTISASIIGAVEWRGGILSDNAAPVTWRATLTADTVAAIEVLRTAFGAAQAPAEASAGVVRDDVDGAEPGSGIVRDAIAPITTDILAASVSFMIPMDFGGSSATAGGAASIAIEWQALVTVNITANIGYASAISVNATALIEASIGVLGAASAPIDAGLSVIGDRSVPIEFLHQTVNLVSDAALPIEFGRVVYVDGVAFIETRKVRPTIGSKLEPDTWEADHEP